MRLRKALAIYFLCIHFVCSAQICINGKIINYTTHTPIPGVLVSIRQIGENKIIKFAQTNSNGVFDIKLADFPKNHQLHFAMMGFASQTIPLKPEQSVYNVELYEEAVELKEVVVKSQGILEKKDTITYMVSNFADVQDKSLADVLKKMPGIEVEKSGAIKYNGISINKFYIEGKDMLDSKYGIATNNIHQKDVSSVEVMENHQPIKALEDISFSQNPAINIRLKEDAKARWVGTVKAGTGFKPFLWNSESAIMRFKKQSQTLNTYKTNNTGNDATREIASLSIDDTFTQFGKNYRLQEYLSVSPDYLRKIDDERSRFNKTHLFSTNNLWSLGKNYDLSSQVTYANNQLTSDKATRTFYFIEDQTITTEATEHAFSNQNQIYGDVTLTANIKTYYLKNKLFTDIHWNNVDMLTTGTYPNRQAASVLHQQISNDLDIIKRSDKKAYTLSSFNLYQTKPQELTVTRKNEVQHQLVQSLAFYSNTNTALSFYLNPVTLSMKLGILGLIRSLKTEITGIPNTLGDLKNDATIRYLNLHVSPEMEYKKNGFEAKFDMPVSFIPLQYKDYLINKKSEKEKLLFSPQLFMRYYFTSRLFTSVAFRHSQSSLLEQSFYEGLIMNNYRNLSQGLIDYKTGNSKSITLSSSYRNPLKAFFTNINVMRSWNYSPRVSNRYFLNEYLLNTYIQQDNRSNVWMLNTSINKGMDIINGIFSLSTSYAAFSGATFQNGNESPYSTDSWNIKSKITSRFGNWCNISYELTYDKNWLKMKKTEMQTSYKNISQLISCNFTPNKVWYLQLVGEHYCNEITKDVSKHLLLADANFTFSFKRGWEINLLIKNIFNQNTYSYNNFNGLTNISAEYIIRPRNVLASVFFRF